MELQELQRQQAEKNLSEKALKSSHKHWLENWETTLTGKGGYYTGSFSCALCNYNKKKCDSCVLYKYGFGCTQPESPYLQCDRDKPETVGDMATLLLLVYLSECNEDTLLK